MSWSSRPTARRWAHAVGVFLGRLARISRFHADRRAKSREVSVDLQVPVAAAFARRAWSEFATAVDALGKADALAAAYWRLRRDDFLQADDESGAAWEALYEALHGRGHRLAALALEGVLRSAILGEATVERVRAILGLFQRRHGIPCPKLLLPATGTWLLRRGLPREALRLAEQSIAVQPDASSKATARLRTCSLRLACSGSHAPSAEAAANEENPYTSALRGEMWQLPAGSVAGVVFAAAEACWDRLRQHQSCQAHDLRFIEAQRQGLEARIAEALRQRCPLALVRLGDADGYGFAPSTMPWDAHGVREQESIWWGKTLTELPRQRVITGFREALAGSDIVGFPYMHRLARDLVVDDRTSPNRRETKLLRLFEGMGEFCANHPDWKPACWADEYCNYVIADAEVMRRLGSLARKMVLVTGFSTCDNLPVPFRGATVVEIPPHARSRGAGSEAFGSRILPEVIDEIAGQVGQLAAPGVLVLVSAGFAGKELLWIAKRRGAVALDLGSAIDPMFGRRTRAIDLLVA